MTRARRPDLPQPRPHNRRGRAPHQLPQGQKTPDNARFFDSPIPVLIHIPAVTVYLLLGAFQFVPSLRRGKRGRTSWHKIAGRILALTGLLAALSGLWMAIFYDSRPGSTLLLVLRLVFGSAMVAFIVLASIAGRRRNYVRHSEWMSRAYAIGIAQGTIVVVTIPWILLVGPVDELTRALPIRASWAISLAVAEYFIYRRAQRAAPKARALSSGPLRPLSAAPRTKPQDVAADTGALHVNVAPRS